jgi:hypothetical protein
MLVSTKILMTSKMTLPMRTRHHHHHRFLSWIMTMIRMISFMRMTRSKILLIPTTFAQFFSTTNDDYDDYDGYESQKYQPEQRQPTNYKKGSNIKTTTGSTSDTG